MKIKQYEKKRKILLSDLMEARTFLGSNKSMWDPTIVSYLFGLRNNFCIFNLEKTLICLKRSLKLIYMLNNSNKKILFVGFPDTESIESIKSYLTKGHLYIPNNYWVNGILTNRRALNLSMRNFVKNLKLKTSKEKLFFYEKVGGIVNLNQKPDLIVVCNHLKDLDVLNEAKKVGIPIISLVNSENNPNKSDYPITGNFTSKQAGKLYNKIIKHSLK